MKAPLWLPNVVLFIGVILISLNFWYIILVPEKKRKEGFDTSQVSNITNQIVSRALTVNTTEKAPSDIEGAQAYRTVLLYIKYNTLKGLKIINDFNKRVYGTEQPVPDDFDPRTIMDNFVNPITGM
jgi:hypothetical protein